jgi:prepilin-type processing-associated H-X9-DG protein
VTEPPASIFAVEVVKKRPEAAKETVATELARCYTRIVIEPTRRPVARFSTAGFSLLELFLVAVILFIVFTLFLSAGSKSGQEKRLAACQINLQNIYAALRTFSQDNNGALPAVPGVQTSEAPLSLLVPKYTTGSEFFICPGGRDKPLPDAQPFADRKISYAYYLGRTLQDGSDAPLVSDAQVDTASKTQGQIVFSPDGKKPGNNHNKFGGNFLFCDGNVQTTPARLAFSLPPATNVILLNPKP